jgi:mRNA-degrading endonuclease toxin of MazEF toxin-antitoxin module
VIRPGEIYYADDPVAGRHPMIVVSRESLNRGDFVLAALCTSARFGTRSALPNCVRFRAGQFGFVKDCVAQCENILSVDKSRLDLTGGPIGVLDDVTFREVVKAIGYVIDSDCEPI